MTFYCHKIVLTFYHYINGLIALRVCNLFLFNVNSKHLDIYTFSSGRGRGGVRRRPTFTSTTELPSHILIPFDGINEVISF